MHLKKEHSTGKRRRSGERDFPLFLTGDSGMDIILARKWGNGIPTMAQVQQKERFISERSQIILHRLNVAEIKLENGDLSKGDTILVTGPTTGAIYYNVDEIRVDLKVTEKALKGELCSIKTADYLRRSDKVYKWVDATDVKNQ